MSRMRTFVTIGIVSGLAIGPPVASAQTVFGTANAGGQQLFQYDASLNSKTTLESTAPRDAAGIALDPQGRLIYSVTNFNEIRRYDPVGKTDQLLVGGFATPTDLVLEPSGTSILVSQSNAGLITRINLTTLARTTFPMQYATGDGPHGLTYDNSGHLFANIGRRTQPNASRVAQLDPTTGAILAVSGFLNGLDGLTFSPSDGKLYAASVTGHLIYRLDPTNLSTPAQQLCTPGSGGPLLGPGGIAADTTGNVYIADYFSSRFVKFNISGGTCAAVGPTTPGIDGLVVQRSIPPP